MKDWTSSNTPVFEVEVCDPKGLKKNDIELSRATNRHRHASIVLIFISKITCGENNTVYVKKMSRQSEKSVSILERV